VDHDELDHLLVPRPDDIVDRKYRVRERLGTGGMGIVFFVEHLHTGRSYALKVLRPALAATPEGQRRFEAEARAIGALRHPNVVDVVDFGYAASGSARFPYLVMERLEGFPLSRTLAGGAGLPWPWVTSVLEQICRGVEVAHAAGIVHGDLKPENVWLTPRTSGGFDVKVLDFGLARAGATGVRTVALPDATAIDNSNHTTVLPWTTSPAGDPSPMSGIAGTPAYMSPERLRGEGLSAAADLYSLGVLAYRILTGGLPFDSAQGKPASGETPLTVRERLAAARPDVPRHALDAVTAALSPNPGDRPPTAVAFSQLLSGRGGSAAATADRSFAGELNMFLDNLWRDVLYGARMLWQKRAYSAIAILTLALGIGANTAIFSVVNTVLLTPLPFDAPDRIMALGQQTPENRAALTQFSFRNFADLRQQSQSFDRLAAYYNLNLTLTGDREAQLLRGTVATADLFPLLGVSAIVGRTFLPEEDAAGGGPGGRPAILSWQTWQQHFGGDAGVIGRAVDLSNSRFTVVGVMPADFRFPIQPQPTEVWISTALDNERPSGPGAIMEARGYRGWRAIGRLKAGVTVEQARSEAGVIAAALAAEFPGPNKDMGIGVRPLHESIVGNLRPTLLLLLGAVAFVLLIACVNVANLLLERAISRQREIKVRLALGASGARIIRQLLTESVLLAGLGGIAGMMLAYWATDLIVALSPDSLARVAETELDLRVLGFTALISLATGLIFGLAPALLIARTDLAESLKEGRRGATASVQTNRTRSLLVVSEVALALVLLAGAGLLINSFVRLQQVAPGFDPSRTLAFNVAPSAGRTSTPEQTGQFYRELIAQLKALPGVVNASMVFQLPLSGAGASTSITLPGGSVYPADRPMVVIHMAGPEYFKTMGIPIARGRDFTDRDDLGAPKVLIVNEALARQYFPNEDPIGKRVAPGFSTLPVSDDESGMREIVGVVADVKHSTLQGATPPEIYFPQSQMPMSAMTMVVRAAGDPRALQREVRAVVQSLDRNAPVYTVRTVEEILDRSVATPRFNTLLIGLFAVVALILTLVGLYGVMSCAVSENTQQIGIRMALGAQRRDVLRVIMGQGMLLTMAGVVIGLGAAFGLTRLMSSLLFGIGSTDPWTFASVAVLLLGVAAAACYLPARRAMNVDPVVALRQE
jgi:putative ABC transport system permease protein